MADILPFGKKQAAKKAVPNTPTKKAAAKKAGKNPTTLCRSGFHRWQVDKETDFLIKEGKLWTRYQCARCGKTRSEWR